MTTREQHNESLIERLRTVKTASALARMTDTHTLCGFDECCRAVGILVIRVGPLNGYATGYVMPDGTSFIIRDNGKVNLTIFIDGGDDLQSNFSVIS